MACCAFAIYLVTLLVWPFRRLLRFGREQAWQPDAAVEWHPGQAASARQVRPHPSRWATAVLVLGVGGALAASAGASMISDMATNEAQLRPAMVASLCGSIGSAMR